MYGPLKHALVTRRRLLGTATAATLAAGAGGRLATTSAAAPAPRTQIDRSLQNTTAEFHGGTSYAAKPQGHFNTFVTDCIFMPPHFYGDLIWQPFALFYWGTKEWLPLMATEWAFIRTGQGSPAASPVAGSNQSSLGLATVEPGADTFQIKLRQGALWSDGTPFTAKDVLATYSVRRLMSNVVWQYLDHVEAPDDYTVNFVMKQPSTVVQRYVLRTSTQSAVLYGDWAKKADDLFASGKSVDDPEGKQLLQQFTQFRPDTVIASGPYNFDPNNVGDAQLTLVRNEQAWNQDQVKFNSFLIYRGETDTISPVVLAKKIDYATHGFAPATEKQMISTGIRIVRPPIYSGPALYMNFGKFPQLADKRVRQALAMAINRDQNGIVSLADSGIGVKYMTGMSDNFVPDWIAEADIAALQTYPFDQEMAASRLQEAGWTKDGDTWKMADGNPASFELTFPAEYADWSAAGSDAAEQLSNFGFKVVPRAITYTQQPVDLDQGKFDLAIQGWGSSTDPHPHYSYTTAFFLHNTLAINNGGQGIQFSLQQDTDVAGKVDLEQLTLDAADGLDEQAQKENVTTIAKVFNELLPIIPLFERYGNNAVLEGVRVKPWPGDEDPIYRNSPYADGINTILTLTGRLEPV